MASKWRSTSALPASRSPDCQAERSSASLRIRPPAYARPRGGGSGLAVELAAAQALVEVEGGADNLEGLVSAEQVVDDDGLVLEGLEVLEEAPDLAHDVGRELRLVGVVAEPWVVGADGDDLVVAALVVAHAHDADRAGVDDAQRVHGDLREHQDVEGVAVVAVGPRDEAV